jgi:hypothetical protein
VGSLLFDIEYKPADEFFALHPDARLQADTKPELKEELLSGALRNQDIPSRAILSKQLIGWGADVKHIYSEKGNVLHIFVSSLEEPAVEAPLLQYLFDQGADPNQYAPRYGTPLDTLMNVPRWLDSDLVPIYDVWFTSPILDFFTPNKRGQDLLDRVRRKAGSHPDLVTRVENYITSHGGTLPPNPYPIFQ